MGQRASDGPARLQALRSVQTIATKVEWAYTVDLRFETHKILGIVHMRRFSFL